MSANLLSLPGELAQLVLTFAVDKYIEAAGAAPGAMTSRAAGIKALASEIDGAVLGNITLAQLQALTAAELAAKQVSVSTQALINGLIGIVGPMLPTATSGLLSAALAADANLFLQGVIAACTAYGA